MRERERREKERENRESDEREEEEERDGERGRVREIKKLGGGQRNRMRESGCNPFL